MMCTCTCVYMYVCDYTVRTCISLHYSATLSVMTSPRGGILDDCIVTKDGPNSFFVVSNAGRADHDWTHLTVLCVCVCAVCVCVCVCVCGGRVRGGEGREGLGDAHISTIHWKRGRAC